MKGFKNWRQEAKNFILVCRDNGKKLISLLHVPPPHFGLSRSNRSSTGRLQMQLVWEEEQWDGGSELGREQESQIPMGWEPQPHAGLWLTAIWGRNFSPMDHIAALPPALCPAQQWGCDREIPKNLERGNITVFFVCTNVEPCLVVTHFYQKRY